MSSWSWKVGLAGVTLVAATALAAAQMPDHSGMHPRMGEGARDHQRIQQTMPHGGMMRGQREHHETMTGTGASDRPTMPGQEAFGTIQEIVRILEADPETDWSKVNIAALREHLIDMNDVTLHASASERALDNGLEISITGEGRTLDAIKRMVPAHAQELGRIGWSAKTDALPNGVKLTVTSADAKQVTKLKALGFMGIMVQGGHHQVHHLMMAKGELTH